ncbi:MAG: hydantoinase/oxoprolinase family protein [Oscillospiraceae bacterium]|nr:hydantoinase/oxoprolinase family protein [Oscillospiraceae bacterium]
MYGLGIDTGGTYTDAVIYDFDSKKILCSAKSLTTHENLSVGISNSLGKIAEQDNTDLNKIEIVSLSTTLATNACVENKGGRAKLIFIGVDKNVVCDVGSNYGLPDADEIYFLDYNGKHNGDIITYPDWDKFSKEIFDFLSDADSVGIVDIHAMNNGAVFEKKAKDIILNSDKFDKQVICGSELFDDLNSVKRGSSALLNARLIPIICDFIDAIKQSLNKYNINAPVVLVRSDGSLMSENFTAVRPVETLLCGPCASVMGGIALSGEENCLVVDMGGTTTDIAIVKDGTPLKSNDGINIGKWRTFVKGIYIDTFGLGGDSAVRYDKNHVLYLDSTRVVPISIISNEYPEIVEKLRELAESDKIHTYLLHEFFYLLKDISEEINNYYTDEERRFCRLLKKSPLIYSEAAEKMDSDVYKLNFARLEREGIIIRCGLTPTDIMCIKGDYNAYGPEAAKLTVKYMSRCVDLTEAEFCDKIYDEIKQKLYINILRILWEHNKPEDYTNVYRVDNIHNYPLTRDLYNLFKHSWENDIPDFSVNISTPLSIVGVGAPIHIFLPDVAKRLGVKCVIPGNAGVANAVGAVMGNITVSCDIEVKPVYGSGGLEEYIVFGKSGNLHGTDYAKAIEFATAEAEKYAYEEAIRRGAVGNITVKSKVVENNAKLRGNSGFLLNTAVNATAVGRISNLG